MTIGNPLRPWHFHPVYKDYLWGGDRIPAAFGRKLPAGIYAESWELSAHPDGLSRGPDGSLTELVASGGSQVLGHRVQGGSFPLLLKLIDARQTLSVQVHPDNESAARYGGEPKTEMWYVLEAAPDAAVYHGFVPGLTREAFLAALASGRAGETLRRVPVKPGDAIFVPGGTVHAIGAGCLLYEVQQSSNTTYRLYDWDRVGPDGKPRALHIEQGLQVARFDSAPEPLARPRLVAEGDGNRVEEIVACPYFRMERLSLGGPLVTDHDGGSFHALFTTAGQAELEWAGGRQPVRHGETWLVPAGLRRYTLCPEGSTQILRVSVP